MNSEYEVLGEQELSLKEFKFQWLILDKKLAIRMRWKFNENESVMYMGFCVNSNKIAEFSNRQLNMPVFIIKELINIDLNCSFIKRLALENLVFSIYNEPWLFFNWRITRISIKDDAGKNQCAPFCTRCNSLTKSVATLGVSVLLFTVNGI